MLEWMQKHKKYLVITVWVSALALVFASMVEWGGGGFSAVSSDSVAKVGDLYISRQEYQRKYNEIYDSVGEFMRKEGVDDGKPIPEIEQDAFRMLVEEKLLISLAQDIGVEATPNEVLDALLNMTDFQDEATRTFDKEKYASLLAANRWTKEAYESFVAKQLLNATMQNFPIAPVTTLESNAFMSAGKIQDIVAVRLLRKDDVLRNAALQVTDSEVRSHWEKNKAQYTEPARYKIAYIALDISSMKAENSSLLKFYKDNERQYGTRSFEQALSDVRQDYGKAILGLASSYMSGMSAKIASDKNMPLQSSNVITTLDSPHLAILQKHFDNDLDMSNIGVQDIPLYTLELVDDGRDFSPLMMAVARGGDDLLAPLEYSSGHWIIPYIMEKAQKQPLPFEQAKPLVENELMAQKRDEEFRKIAHSELGRTSMDSMQATLPIHFSLWQERDNASYKQLLALGVPEFAMRQAVEGIMRSDKKNGIIFLNDEALIFDILKQEMPSHADLIQITNAEDDALQRIKIYDLRNAMFEYALKHYKVIDYRRQN